MTFSQSFFEKKLCYSEIYCDFAAIFDVFVLGDAIIDVFVRAFSKKMCLYSSNYCDFQRFLLFRNKARNAGCSLKNAGMREVSQNAGIPA